MSTYTYMNTSNIIDITYTLYLSVGGIGIDRHQILFMTNTILQNKLEMYWLQYIITFYQYTIYKVKLRSSANPEEIFKILKFTCNFFIAFPPSLCHKIH